MFVLVFLYIMLYSIMCICCVGVNSYIQGVLSYIVLDIIKKAVMPTYVSAYTDYPFEMPGQSYCNVIKLCIITLARKADERVRR